MKRLFFGKSQHLPRIGTGQLGDVVAGNDVRQGIHTALGIQRMDLGIGALVCNIFLDEQVAVRQRGNLRGVGDALGSEAFRSRWGPSKR